MPYIGLDEAIRKASGIETLLWVDYSTMQTFWQIQIRKINMPIETRSICFNSLTYIDSETIEYEIVVWSQNIIKKAFYPITELMLDYLWFT
jgi:hypothetical protein